MIDQLKKVTSIAITTDFWSDRKQKSYLVLTGHYIDDEFQQKSTVLRFSTFPKRHYSASIGLEIEKQLTELKIFEKISTITCDGAPNMVGLFEHLTRDDIRRIQCLAHKLHLIICNGLDLWAKKTTVVGTNNSVVTDVDERLSQTVDKIKINDDAENGQEEEIEEVEEVSTYYSSE